MGFHLNALSNPKLRHTLGLSVRGGAQKDGGAWCGPAAHDADDRIVCPGENKLSYPPDDGKMTSLGCRWKPKQETIFAKP